jgi:molybdate transport repressor ModE-like protein
MGDPGWDLYRTFLAVMREGSLSAAARALGLTQPTAGRHIEALEEALGAALFTRSPGGLAPTAAATALLPHAESMAAAAAALVRSASAAAEEEGGVVRVTASEIIGGEVLPPILARFRETHPRIVVELALNNRTEDLLRHEADIAVRMLRPSQAALVVRRIGKLALGAYAHRRYVEAHGAPRDLAELAAHGLIGFDRETTSLRSVSGLPETLTRDLFAFRCDSDLAQLAALRAGFGIGFCQHRIAARDPDLVPILHDKLRFELEMWLAMHEDLRNTRRVRLMFDHLAGELSAYAAGQGGKEK